MAHRHHDTAPAVGPPADPTQIRALLARAVLSVVAAGLLVVVARLWGFHLVDQGRELKLSAVPWFGRFKLDRVTPAVWPALLGSAVVVFGPPVARRLRFVVLLVVTAATAAAWAVLLFLTEGPLRDLGTPLEGRFEYLPVVPEIDDPGRFLETFTDDLATYPIHVQGHPPGTVLLLWVLDRIGLDGSMPAALLFIAIAASGLAAVLLTVRAVASEAVARRVAPFLTVLPAAVWIATTADAMYLGVGAWAVALVVLGSHHLAAGRPSGWGVAVAGGVVFGLGVHLSYGLAPLVLIGGGVLVVRRDWRALGAAAAGGVAVIAAFTAAGFWLLDGLAATSERYEAGVASQRPYEYFVVANLAVLAVSLGPATVAALATMRRRPAPWLVWCALAVVASADLSGLSKGEVERIWLPYVPWLVVAIGWSALPPVVPWRRTRLPVDRVLLALQALTGLAMALFLRSPW